MWRIHDRVEHRRTIRRAGCRSSRVRSRQSSSHPAFWFQLGSTWGTLSFLLHYASLPRTRKLPRPWSSLLCWKSARLNRVRVVRKSKVHSPKGRHYAHPPWVLRLPPGSCNECPPGWGPVVSGRRSACDGSCPATALLRGTWLSRTVKSPVPARQPASLPNFETAFPCNQFQPSSRRAPTCSCWGASRACASGRMPWRCLPCTLAWELPLKWWSASFGTPQPDLLRVSRWTSDTVFVETSLWNTVLPLLG